MPELPPSEQIQQLYQELTELSKRYRGLADRVDTLAGLVHEQGDEQVARITALETTYGWLKRSIEEAKTVLAKLQAQKGTAEAVDRGDAEYMRASIFGAIEGASQVQKGVDGRSVQ